MRCFYCGCTDENACLGGCTWVVRLAQDTGVCSQCSVRYTRSLIDALEHRNDDVVIDVVQAIDPAVFQYLGKEA